MLIKQVITKELAIEIIKSCRIDWRAGNEKNY